MSNPTESKVQLHGALEQFQHFPDVPAREDVVERATPEQKIKHLMKVKDLLAKKIQLKDKQHAEEVRALQRQIEILTRKLSKIVDGMNSVVMEALELDHVKEIQRRKAA